MTDKLIWQMEMRIAEDVSLEDLARACAVSPYHLARAFRSATGMAPKTYMRARRLSVAAKAIAGGADIIGAALDAQYTSQAAFTRAFSAYFGIPPGRVRAARSIMNLKLMEPLSMQHDMIVPVGAPTLKQRDGFRVVGPGTTCRFGEINEIPALWQDLNGRMGLFPDPGKAAFGVSKVTDNEGGFRYVAGVVVGKDFDIPEGMEPIDLPAGTYAVFSHNGHIADFPKTVYSVWNKALPDAGLEPRQAPEFELYDHRFDVATGRGTVELWIPVVAG